jgi:hypothetical protein
VLDSLAIHRLAHVPADEQLKCLVSGLLSRTY